MFCKNAFNFFYMQTHLLCLLNEQLGHKKRKKLYWKHLKNNYKLTLITGKEMQSLISSTPCLAKRTVPQMRVWLHTQKKKLNNS